MTQLPAKVTNQRYRLGYHIMPKSGWINDPNGFSYYDGYYHIFYQYYPYAPEWGPMHWGHARSKDLVHWETLPIALTPGDVEDKNGCFSGTAIVKDDQLYLFYTGHHYYEDNDPDHFWQNQNLAYSSDGIHFTKYQNNPIIAEPPSDNTHHFRDPKVWQHNNQYYMIVGSQNDNELGRIILYRSDDLLNWDYLGPVAQSNGQLSEGYMWECPDFFELDNQFVFLLSPQGMESEEEQYLNLFQNGYMIGQFDYDSFQFSHNQFTELDHGHDFYAPQTMQSPDGRRILIAWMAMWESNMPEQQDGWSGALTLPRELKLVGQKLYMQPIDELTQLRIDNGVHQHIDLSNKQLLSQDTSFVELNVETVAEDFTIILNNTKQDLITIEFDNDHSKFRLYRHDLEDYRYATIDPCSRIKLQIFIDKSSLEVFINKGEAVFTERYYSECAPEIWMSSPHNITANVDKYHLESNAVNYE